MRKDTRESTKGTASAPKQPPKLLPSRPVAPIAVIADNPHSHATHSVRHAHRIHRRYSDSRQTHPHPQPFTPNHYRRSPLSPIIPLTPDSCPLTPPPSSPLSPIIARSALTPVPRLLTPLPPQWSAVPTITLSTASASAPATEGSRLTKRANGAIRPGCRASHASKARGRARCRFVSNHTPKGTGSGSNAVSLTARTATMETPAASQTAARVSVSMSTTLAALSRKSAAFPSTLSTGSARETIRARVGASGQRSSRTTSPAPRAGSSAPPNPAHTTIQGFHAFKKCSAASRAASGPIPVCPPITSTSPTLPPNTPCTGRAEGSSRRRNARLSSGRAKVTNIGRFSDMNEAHATKRTQAIHPFLRLDQETHPTDPSPQPTLPLYGFAFFAFAMFENQRKTRRFLGFWRSPQNPPPTCAFHWASSDSVAFAKSYHWDVERWALGVLQRNVSFGCGSVALGTSRLKAPAPSRYLPTLHKKQRHFPSPHPASVQIFAWDESKVARFLHIHNIQSAINRLPVGCGYCSAQNPVTRTRSLLNTYGHCR